MMFPAALRLILALVPVSAWAMPNPDSPCVAAAAAAAAATGVPFAVLFALSQTETARGAGDLAEPWAWAINDAGESLYFESRGAAVAHAMTALAAGRQNFDVGCFQLNHHWHGDAFASVDAMFDPAANALYAARFLARLHDESGDWSVAAGAYHSRTAALAERYRLRFEAYLAAAPDAPDAPATRDQRATALPGLQAGTGMPVLGSLVPLGL